MEQSGPLNDGTVYGGQPEVGTAGSANGSEPEDGICDSSQKLLGTAPVLATFSLLYVIIFCLGFFGNLLVSLVVIRNKNMHNVTNFFILNLAVSDVIMCLFAVPFTPLQSFTGRWMFGKVLCKLCPFSQGMSVYVSTLTLTIIALDRYVVILYPFRARMQPKTCAALVAIIDVLAVLFTAPYAVNVDLVVFHENEDVNSNVGSSNLSSSSSSSSNEAVALCTETWVGTERTVYGAFTNVAQFVLPFFTIILCYTAVIRKMGRWSTARPGARRSAAREEQERARNLKTNRMLISMVVAFGICWLPLNIINFLADAKVRVHCWAYHHFAFFISHILAMSSTCYNPFLYGWHNESFQKEFVRMVPALRVICGDSLEDEVQLRLQARQQQQQGQQHPRQGQHQGQRQGQQQQQEGQNQNVAEVQMAQVVVVQQRSNSVKVVATTATPLTAPTTTGNTTGNNGNNGNTGNNGNNGNNSDQLQQRGDKSVFMQMTETTTQSVDEVAAAANAYANANAAAHHHHQSSPKNGYVEGHARANENSTDEQAPMMCKQDEEAKLANPNSAGKKTPNHYS